MKGNGKKHFFPEAVQSYIDQAHAYPRLTAKEEATLFRQWKRTKSPAVKRSILQANLRYVVAIALGYRYYPVDVADLIAEGNLGLLVAFDKFDPKKGTRMITYGAYWIRALILNLIIRSWHGGRTGAGPYRSKYFFKIKREKARSICRHGECEEAYEELARKMNLPVARVSSMARTLERPDISMDSPVRDGSNTTLQELMQDKEPSPEEITESNETQGLVRRLVQDALQSLDNRERYIIEKRILDEEKTSLADIGRELGVSRERARQLEGRAKKKIRWSLENCGYEVYNTQCKG
ncbi:MAG: sigma-70 family RNA polymerase sigma factor [Pseudomonadota bacterium]